MSTAEETTRITRAASRARSVESDAGTVATTRAASARTGGRGSRRGPTPPAEEPAAPKVASKTNRAYGTQGLTSPSDQLVADAAPTALNSIANAVTDAETIQPLGGPGGLSTVNEEVEGPAGPIEENQPLEFHEQRLSFFSLQYWAPRGGQTTTAGYFLDAERRRHTVQVPYAPIADPRALKWSLILVMFSMFLLVPAYQALFSHVIPRYLPGFGGVSVHNASQHQVMHPFEYDNLLNRITNIEHHLKQSSQSFTPKPKQQVNWFLPGYGAVIDPHLSSPIATTECDTTTSFWPWNYFNACVNKPLSQPHMSALTAWEDPGADRWCAPRSGGKLQLAVELSRNVAPTELIVEYGAMDATPEGGMGAAPKEIELWIQIEDDKMRATIGDVISRMHSHLLKESSPQHKTLSPAQALGHDWVPVGRWAYNIYEHDNIQSFRVPISLHAYGVHTAKVAVRVNSNWGNVMFTCINRLRLHGRDVTGITEALGEDFRGWEA